MAAVTIPVQPPPAYVVDAPTAATFRRRRLTALLATVLIAVAIPTVALRAAAAFEAPASRLERRPDPPVVVIAQPGDTLWSIARQLQPEGDVRPLVDRLVRMRGGAQLHVGDRVVLP